MAEVVIIKKQIIIVNEVEQNTYGDLTFTDKEGNSYKVSVKRKQYFDKIIIPNMAVQLNYAMSSFGKEYIYSAVQVKDKLLPPVEPPIEPSTASEKPKDYISGEEKGMWFKELGARIGDGSIEKDFPKSVVSIKTQYYKKMSQITGIKFKEEA